MTEVTSTELHEFLNHLARCYRHSGRLYLAGGSSLILVSSKVSTLDIDLKIEAAPAHHAELVRCLRQVSRQLQISVKEASPDPFIPLPPGHADRHQFIARYGSLDVFHFDFYSIALSKIHRGNEKDFADVSQMIAQEVIEWEALRASYQAILPRLPTFGLHADPEGFVRRFTHLEHRLAS